MYQKLVVFTTFLSLAVLTSACPFCYQSNGLSIGETKVMGNGVAYSWIRAS